MQIAQASIGHMVLTFLNLYLALLEIDGTLGPPNPLTYKVFVGWFSKTTEGVISTRPCQADGVSGIDVK